MKTNFSGKYEKIYEDTIYRYQQGGITFGDIVKFKKDALNNDKVKGLSEGFKDRIKNAMETDLNLRVGAVKSIRPSTSMNYDGYGIDSPTDHWVDIVVEYAPGLWRDPITVPMEVLEYVDLGANLAPVPDSLKRASDESKPAEVVAKDKERKNPSQNTKIATGKATEDGRSQAPKPTERKSPKGESKKLKESTLEDTYDKLLTENIKGENIGEGDEVWYADGDGVEYEAVVLASHPTGYTIEIRGSNPMNDPHARFKPGQELQVGIEEIQKIEDATDAAPEIDPGQSIDGVEMMYSNR